MERSHLLALLTILILDFGSTVHAQTDPTCDGAPLPRLSVGGLARVTPGDPNNVRDVPARSGTLVGAIPGGEVFAVLEGPECVDGLNWWRVEYESLTGWTVEGAGTDYWVEPYQAPTSTPTPAPAADYVFPVESINQLAVGVTARVINDDPRAETITLTVRAEPSRSAAAVAQLLEGDLVTLVGGMEEADGLRWWQIETETGTIGWTIEGLLNVDRGIYERTLLAICPAEGERIAYRVDDYIVTSGLDGSDPCTLDYLSISPVHTFWEFFFYFPNRFVPSPDGEYFLYMDGRGGSSSDLYRLSRDGRENVALTQGGGLQWAEWSPDGERIALSRLPQIWTMRADGSVPAALTQGNRPKPWVTWLPDSETVVYLEQERGHSQVYREIESVFFLINTQRGGLREILRTTLDIRDAAVSPDGTMLAVVGWLWEQGEPIDNVTWVIDLATTEVIFESATADESIVWTPDSRALVYRYDGTRLVVLPVDGNDPQTTELVTTGGLAHWYTFIRWETDNTFLAIDSENVVLRVDISTGEVEPY